MQTNQLIKEVPFIPDEHTLMVNEISIQFTPVFPLKGVDCIDSSATAYKVLYPFFEDVLHIQEKFVVLFLNNLNKVIGVYALSTGGITSTVVDPRLLLSVGVKCLATSMIIAHNHPSGNMLPSENDKIISKRIKEVAGLVDIKMLDHLIITGEKKYISFEDEGILV